MMREVCNMQDHTFVAVGDYNKDLEMIMEADVGICPSNAGDEVRSASDIILEESCEEDAIAKVIDIIFDRCKA
jgi:hydroxymethylpyrimidine pyrophosphatase-like HAD family hydrolase